MKRPTLALFITLMMVGTAFTALATTPTDLSSEPSNRSLATDPGVRVEDLGAYSDDQDGDLLLDGIQIVSKVIFNRTGDFVLVTKLSPSDGSWWLSTSEPVTFEADAAAPVEKYYGSYFEGWKLNSRKVNGYLVATVEVVSAATNAPMTSLAKTLPEYYRYTQFEPSVAGATVQGLGDLRKLDFDGNGRFEILEAPVEIEATTPGLYRVVMVYKYWAALSGVAAEPRALWQTVTNMSQLEAGHNEVPMWLSGGHIMTSKNVTIWVQVYKSAFAGQPWSATYQVLDQREFEAPSRKLFTGAHLETGVDADSDGLFDLLRFEVGLDVLYPGEYTMTAVMLPTGWTREYTTGSLTDFLNRLLATKRAAKATWKWTYAQGPGKAEFLFDGHLVNAWGEDGSFDVYVVWTGPAPFMAWYEQVRTIEFRADDFVHPVPPLEFAMDHSDKGVSRTGGEPYVGLRVNFNVFVNTPGQFTAFASLSFQGREVAYARSESKLDKGPGIIELVFPGEAIFLSKATGTFTVVVWVQGAGYDWNDTTLVAPMTARHTTAKYSFEQFAPPQFQVGPKDPQPVEDLDFVLLRTGILAVRIDRNQPDLTFYMARDEGTSALFRVVYTRLLAFADSNGDGAPQANEVTYTSALWSYSWTMTQVSLYEDPESGRVATFTMSTKVDLVEQANSSTDLARPLSTVKDFAEVTLTFTLASHDMNRTDEVGTYLILGGMELKVDIGITVLTPVDGIDFLTIEQALRDDRGAYSPDPDEANGGTPAEVLRRYKDRSDLKQLIEFRQRRDVAGFYSWVRKAEVTSMDGGTEVMDVRAALLMTDGSLLLYLSYPYDVNTTVIFHDPSLGVYEGNIPGIPDEWEAVFNPMLFGMAAIAAAAMIYGLRARPRRPDERELDWEDEFTEPNPPGGLKGPEPPTSRSPDDGIPSLPEDRVVSNGSTILLQPPPSSANTVPDQEEWVHWED